MKRLVVVVVGLFIHWNNMFGGGGGGRRKQGVLLFCGLATMVTFASRDLTWLSSEPENGKPWVTFYPDLKAGNRPIWRKVEPGPPTSDWQCRCVTRTFAAWVPPLYSGGYRKAWTPTSSYKQASSPPHPQHLPLGIWALQMTPSRYTKRLFEKILIFPFSTQILATTSLFIFMDLPIALDWIVSPSLQFHMLEP